jgi:hypothetical protein
MASPKFVDFSDAFPQLRTLEIDGWLKTSWLLSWPMRDLKELRVSLCQIDLKEDQFKEVRNLVKRQNLPISLDVSEPELENDPAFERELQFWETAVEPSPTIAFC